MDFFNDEMHQDMVDMYRDFAKNSCGPIAAEIDEAERFPEENVPIMGEMGLLGIPFPEEYGGIQRGLRRLWLFAGDRIVPDQPDQRR